MIRLRCAPPGVPSTEIDLGADVARDLDAWLRRGGEGRAHFALVDANVVALHADRLRALGPRLELPGGESVKTLAVLERVLRALARAEVDRSTQLVVAGGGSLGDLGGLAAALYARGIDLALFPPTLLAMVDSSVGGKTAIDLPEGKNLVGAFHPARQVAIDFAFLATLPDAEYRSGLGELLKVAIGLSPALFALLEQQAAAVLARDTGVVAQAVHLALAAKIAVVELDFAERDQRRLLNLGHTLGHALEASGGYTMPHGHAVARGLHFALAVAESGGHLAAADAARARGLLERIGFRADPLPPRAALLPFLRRDKKADGDAVHFVVPTAIGASTTVRLSLTTLSGNLPR